MLAGWLDDETIPSQPASVVGGGGKERKNVPRARKECYCPLLNEHIKNK